MTSIILKKKNSNIVAFAIKGHAGFAESGEDIICSAISVLSQSILIGIEEVLNIKADYKIQDGFLNLDLSKNNSEDIEKCQVLLKTMEKSFESIKVAYGKYIKLETEEV